MKADSDEARKTAAATMTAGTPNRVMWVSRIAALIDSRLVRIR
nr:MULTISPECIES: hypothetical protein [unclassified Frankia]